MNKKTEKLLESLELPEIDLPLHKRALRKQLLTMYTQKPRKGGDIFFMKRKVFRIWAVSTVSLALIIGFGITTLLPKTPQAQAQEIVNDAMQRVVRLSDDQRKVLEERIKADLKSSLEEAKQAKDLTVVPEEEIERIDLPKADGKKDFFMAVPKGERVMLGKKVESKDMKPGTRVAFPGKIMAPHGVKVLRYTGADGQKIVLGINEQNEPVMKLMLLTKEKVKDLPEGETIHFERAL